MAKSDSHTREAGAVNKNQSSAEANAFNMARMRSDLVSEADSDGAPSSPHFYSSSVRQNSPSVESYSTDTDDGAGEEHSDHISQTASASEQQLEEEAVKLDLLRRTHAQRAKATLEQLQMSSAASLTGSQGSDTPRKNSGGISSTLVRERSQQLRQASGDVKRLAVEQRTSAEDAVADFLLQEDIMINESAGRVSEDSRLSQAGSSGSLRDDDRQGMQRSLSRHLERLRRAEQAITDAEADEKIADQLVALERSMSQDNTELVAEEGAGQRKADAPMNQQQDSVPASRHLLHNISEDSQEGHMSSNSNHSQMAASAFAALSHLDDFGESEAQGTREDEDHALRQTAETPSETAEAAADPTIEHHVEQASSIDKADSSDRATSGAQQPLANATPQAANNADAQSAASAEMSATPFQPGSVATPPPEPSHAPKTRRAAVSSPAAGERQDSQPSQAGSSPGSHTFDSALHEGISELVQAPNSADHTRQSGQEQPAALPDHDDFQSDEEDDLAVVSNQEQAQAAQVAANDFIQSSRPTTPDTDYQDPPSSLPEPEEPAQQEEDLASSTRRYLNDSLQQASMPEAFEPEEFKGMLFHDGVDSQGRPVIVVNTDAVGTGRKARSAAMQYMLHRLEPIVTQVVSRKASSLIVAILVWNHLYRASKRVPQSRASTWSVWAIKGPYVLVMVATGRHQNSNKLPAMWLISAYRSLSKPFRKNVRYIVLVRPTSGLKTLVAIIRPFVSSKAAKKVKKVNSLAGIATATDGEVSLQHLGSRFAAASGDYILQDFASPATSSPSYDMPNF